MTTNHSKIHEVLQELAEAHYMGNIKSIAVVTINHNNEPELRIAITPGYMYSISTGLDLLRLDLLNKIMRDQSKIIRDQYE